MTPRSKNFSITTYRHDSHPNSVIKTVGIETRKLVKSCFTLRIHLAMKRHLQGNGVIVKGYFSKVASPFPDRSAQGQAPRRQLTPALEFAPLKIVVPPALRSYIRGFYFVRLSGPTQASEAPAGPGIAPHTRYASPRRCIDVIQVIEQAFYGEDIYRFPLTRVSREAIQYKKKRQPARLGSGAAVPRSSEVHFRGFPAL